MKRFLAMLLAVMLVIGVLPMGAMAGDAAAPVKVKLTVFIAGEFAKDKENKLMYQREVTVTDKNSDGTLTLDEALQVAHETYHTSGASAYVTETGSYGLQVKTLWGVETDATGYYKNHTSTNGVGVETVAEGDQITVFTYYDSTGYSDRYSFFTDSEKTVTAGEEFTLTLKAMQYDDNFELVSAGIVTAPIGVYDMETGTYSVPTCFRGEKITDTSYMPTVSTSTNGEVKFSITEPGTYYVTGQYNSDNYKTYLDAGGTAPNYLVPAICVVTVNAATPSATPLTGTVTLAGETAVGSTLTATINVNAEAENYDIEWYRGSDKIDGQTAATYVTTNDDVGKAISVKVVGKNAYSGDVTSNSITVSAPAAPSTPTFTTNLSTDKITYSKNATPTALTVVADGGENAGTLSYKWERSTDKTAWTVIDGETSASFTPSTASVGTTYYRCIVANALNGSETSATSAVATVEVKEPTPVDATITAQWPNFRGNVNNMAIISAKTPKSAETTELKWAVLPEGSGYTSAMLLVDNCLITTRGDQIFKLRLTDGAVVAQSTMSGTVGLESNVSATYGEGLIFRAMTGGKVEAFNAKDLSSVWVYTAENATGWQGQSPALYHDGKLYVGFGSQTKDDMAFVCLNAKTGEKLWSYNQKQYYWAGATIVGDFIVVGNDAGELLTFKTTYGSEETVEPVAKENVPGNVRSSMAVENGRVYFTTANTNKKMLSTAKPAICSATVNAETGAISDLKTVELTYNSTSTPVVYGDYVYFGQAGKFKTGGAGLVIAKKSDLSIVTVADTGVGSNNIANTVQSSPLLSTAYLAGEGKLYFYCTYNNNPGGVKLVTVEPAKLADDAENAVTVSDLYIPETDKQNYCICSVICDTDGTLYYRNDSNYLFALKTKTSGGSNSNSSGSNSGSTGSNTPSEKTASVTMNFSMDGKLVKHNVKLTVRDVDEDGSLTLTDAYSVFHEEYYPGGTSGYEESDGWISKFWGDTSANYGLTKNHKWVNGALETIKKNDVLDVFVYQDTSPEYTDLLTWFAKDNYTGKTGSGITFTVNGLSVYKNAKAAPEGATVTITGPNGTKSTTETDENGSFTLSFPDAGTYTLDVGGTCSYTISGTTNSDAPVVPSRCTVTISGTSTGGSIGGATAGSTESTEDTVTTVNPSATANKNGEATANVGSGTMKDAISESKNDGSSAIVIEPEVKGEASKVTVNVPVSSAASVGKDAKADLTVKTDVGTITLPAEELKNLSGGGNLTISVEAKKDENGKTTGEVEVNITKGDEKVEMKGVSVTVPAENGKTNIVLVLVHEDGTEEVLKKSIVTENGVNGLVDGSCTVKAVEKSSDFGDTANHWAKDSAEFVANRGIFNGTGSKEFSPDLPMNRAMVATVLHRLENAPKANGKTNYTDKLDVWAEKGIAWATENEIVTGYAGQFNGDRAVTRQELATMLYRYAKVVGLDTDSKGDLSKFADGGSTADWAKEAMIWAVQNSLFNGKTATTLDPTGTASRAEVAVVTERLVKLMVK